MKCNKCGAELLPHDSFCGICGNRIEIFSANSSNVNIESPFQLRAEMENSGQESSEIQYKHTQKTLLNEQELNSGEKSIINDNSLMTTKKKKNVNLSIVVHILVTILFLFALFTVFNYLIMTNRIDTFKYDFLEGYKESLGVFLYSNNSNDVKIEADKSKIDTITTKSTEKKEEIESIKMSLEEFYQQKYNKKNTGMALEDFNGDGREEMIVIENRTHSNGRIKNFTLTYITLIENKPVIKDSMTVNDTRMFPEDEFDYSGYSGVSTKLEAYANEKGYINVNYYFHFQGSSVNYIIFCIKNEKIAEEKHIFDPGYTSGHGLYEYEGYFDNYEKAEIYNNEPGDDSETDEFGYNYKNYDEAINGQLNKYGFSFTGHDEMSEDFWMNKCHINEKSDKTKTIYKYSKQW